MAETAGNAGAQGAVFASAPARDEMLVGAEKQPVARTGYTAETAPESGGTLARA